MGQNTHNRNYTNNNINEHHYEHHKGVKVPRGKLMSRMGHFHTKCRMCEITQNCNYTNDDVKKHHYEHRKDVKVHRGSWCLEWVIFTQNDECVKSPKIATTLTTMLANITTNITKVLKCIRKVGAYIGSFSHKITNGSKHRKSKVQ